MSPTSQSAGPTNALGGVTSVFLFVVVLVAFVTGSSVTQYIEGNLGFRQPYFLLYCAHSSFIAIFPLHILYLHFFSKVSVRDHLSNLRAVIAHQLSPTNASGRLLHGPPFPSRPLFNLIILLSVFINLPALLWYVSVSLTSIGSVTALWNTNTFWVYLLCVVLYKQPWERRKLFAVFLACCGVLMDVFGGYDSSRAAGPPSSGTGHPSPDEAESAPSPLLGDALAFAASLALALYQVLYKQYAALPNDPEAEYERVPNPEELDLEQPPFALHPNFLTSCIGVFTAVVLGLGFPILHWLGWERFRLPPDLQTLGCVAIIAFAGLLFNGGFMILLGCWGPVLTSVGNLMTIVLVFLSDVFIAGHRDAITFWRLVGSGMIVVAFAVLVFDIMQKSRK